VVLLRNPNTSAYSDKPQVQGIHRINGQAARFETDRIQDEVIVLRKSPVQPFSERGKESASLLEFYRGRPMELPAALERDGFEVVAGATYAKRSAVSLPESFDLLTAALTLVNSIPSETVGAEEASCGLLSS